MPGQAPILGCVLALPLLGTAAVLALPARHAARPWLGARAIAVTFTVATLVAAALAVCRADFTAAPGSMLLRFRVFDTTLAADALAVPLLVATSALAGIAVWASYGVKHRLRHYYALFLLFLAAALATLVTQNTLTYLICMAIGAVVLGALLSGWGADRRIPAGRHFLYFALFAVMAILGFLLHHLGTAAFSGALPDATAPASPIAPLGFWLLLLACAALAAILPAHWWLADAAAESATPIAVLTLGIWQTLGAYTLLRLAPGLRAASLAAESAATSTAGPGAVTATTASLLPLAVLAAGTILYASLAAVGQTNLKRLAAFLSIALMGFTLLGIAAATPASLAGTAHLLFARPLAIALLILLAGMIEQRLGHCDLSRLGGLAHHLPSLGTFGTLAILAATAVPVLATFPGTLLTILGTFQHASLMVRLLAVVATLGLAVLLVTGVHTAHRTFLGAARPEHSNIQLLSISERHLLILLTLASVALGVYPSLITETLRWAIMP